MISQTIYISRKNLNCDDVARFMCAMNIQSQIIPYKSVVKNDKYLLENGCKIKFAKYGSRQIKASDLESVASLIKDKFKTNNGFATTQDVSRYICDFVF
jgi:hypothetical protein